MKVDVMNCTFEISSVLGDYLRDCDFRRFAGTDDFGGRDHTLLESIEQGEDNAKHSYESALKTKLPAEIHELVRNQYASVKAAPDRVRAWRDEKAA